MRAWLTAAAILLSAGAALAAGPGFTPDTRWDAASLGPVRGAAEWRVQAGELVGRARGPGGGWVAATPPLQDVGFFSAFRCPAGCEAGLLLRAAATADGGVEGIYVPLDEADGGAYRLRLDGQGREVARTRLAAAPSMIRIAPAPSPGPPPATAAPRPRPAVEGPAMPVGPADGALRPSDWNTVEVLLDANIVRALVNSARSLASGVTDAAGAGFGPVLLHVAAGEVHFKDIGWKDLGRHPAPTEVLSPRFDIQRLDPFLYSWGVTVGDVNHDGATDVIAGPNYFPGPAFTERREFALSDTYSPSTDSPVFQVELAADFDGDGWVDILDASLNRPFKLYVNPRGQSRRWDVHEVVPRGGGELAMLTDLGRDGRPEVLAYLGGALALASPDPANPTGPWRVRPISAVGAWGQHGMGVGDINGDGRLDVVQAQGWFEQPAPGVQGLWTYHPQAFSRAGRTAVGAALMGVYDINGDGLADVVTALQAHDAGLAWFEQVRGPAGRIDFREHPIMGGFGDPANAGGVVFTQPHGSAVADIDRDGVPDFVVGKRHWSHHAGTTDPDADAPAVLYVYRTVRDTGAPGGARFEPELIHNRSGAGSQVEAVDLDGNGAVDLVTTGDLGTFVFRGRR